MEKCLYREILLEINVNYFIFGAAVQHALSRNKS